MASKDFVNYYALLGITKDADEAAIRKAYRKRALELHPDKNPDNPKAEELFMAIKIASDILLDKQQRSELDAKLFAQEASAARFKAMDSARARMREELESREKQASAASRVAQQAASGNAAELERLRRQGREAAAAYSEQQQQEHAQRARVQAGAGTGSASASAAAAAAGPARGGADEADFDVDAAVLVRWTTEVSSRMGEASSSTTTLSERQLRSLFKLYGALRLVLGRKARSACLVFDSIEAAEAAVAVPPDGFRVSRLTSPAEAQEDRAGGREQQEDGQASAAAVLQGAEGSRAQPAYPRRLTAAADTGSAAPVRAPATGGLGTGLGMETVPPLSTVLALEADMLAAMQQLAAAQAAR